MSDILDRMLAGMPDVQKNPPRGKYEVKRLSREANAPVVFELQGLPYGRIEELRGESEQNVHIVLAGVVSPDLRDPNLMARYGAPTPAEALKSLLLPGEIEAIARAVERLSGFRIEAIVEIKNV